MKKNIMKMNAKKIMTTGLSIAMALSMSTPVFGQTISSDSTGQTYTDSSSGGHAVYVSGSTLTLTNPTITKTGDSSSEDADFYGTNAAVLAENNANLTIKGGTVTSNGSHANGIFSYGTATVNVSNTEITTNGNNSGGIMPTGGAPMNATDLTINTSGNSSAAIRSDRGGGDVNVSGGSYTTSGTGSPAIYSTADIDVENAALTSNASEAIVIEGKNSVALKNSKVVGNNTKLNGQAKNYDSIFIYQSMSGDASVGTAEFSSEGGSITSKNGDTFYVTNTSATIDINNTTITNSSSGDFLKASAAAWGTSGSNGGKVTLTTSNETFTGNIETDSVSSLNMSLKSGSSYTGAINPDGDTGTVAVTISEDSTWKLTGDSYVDSLDVDSDGINLNGHTLYVNGTAYTAGTASEGTITDSTENSSQTSGPNTSDPAQGTGSNTGMQTPPASDSQNDQNQGQQPPEMSNNENGDSQQPPAAPTDENGNTLQPPTDQTGDQANQTTDQSGQTGSETTVAVESITISGASHHIAAGKTIQLTASVNPANATDPTVTWSSSNSTYATVDANGLVRTKAAGKGKTVTITATSSDGKVSASYRIKIRKGRVTSVKIKGKNSVKAGKSIKLKAKVKAGSGAYKTLQWSSSNTDYASVNTNGKVTAKKAGKGHTVTITASALDGSGVTAKKTVTIK